MLNENKEGRNAAENAVSDVENLQENEKVFNFAKTKMEAKRSRSRPSSTSLSSTRNRRQVSWMAGASYMT